MFGERGAISSSEPVTENPIKAQCSNSPPNWAPCGGKVNSAKLSPRENARASDAPVIVKSRGKF
jgi:hypothetical protein